MKLKTVLLTAGGCLSLLFSGCLVISVAPYYNKKEQKSPKTVLLC